MLSQSFKKSCRARAFKVLLVFCFAVLFLACQAPPPTDMRQLAPAESLLYLETQDLSKTLESLTTNKIYKDLTGQERKFSALKNVQAAVVITGIEASEKEIAPGTANLTPKPRFALIADTHAGDSTAASLIENQIGSYVKDEIDGEAKLEKIEREKIKIYKWTWKDARNLYASSDGSVIYISNDETVLEKCLQVKRGEAENLLKNESLARQRENFIAGDNLAFGYMSQEGVAQLANFAGVSVAIESSEEDLVRSFVAKYVPGVIQKTTTEISWISRKTEQGIEDKINAKLTPEVSSVLKETIVAGDGERLSNAEYIPANFESLTCYKLQNPQIAWRSVLLSISNQMDAIGSKLLAGAADSFFEPYGISDGEAFLAQVSSEIVTLKLDDNGDKSVVITSFKDEEAVKKAIGEEIDFKKPAEKTGEANVWKSEDGSLAAAIIGKTLILGEASSIADCLKAKDSGQNFAKAAQTEAFKKLTAPVVTLTKDEESAVKVSGVLGDVKEDVKSRETFYTVESRFTNDGFERKTVSDFGLIGTMVQQLDEE